MTPRLRAWELAGSGARVLQALGALLWLFACELDAEVVQKTKPMVLATAACVFAQFRGSLWGALGTLKKRNGWRYWGTKQEPRLDQRVTWYFVLICAGLFALVTSYLVADEGAFNFVVMGHWACAAVESAALTVGVFAENEALSLRISK